MEGFALMEWSMRMSMAQIISEMGFRYLKWEGLRLQELQKTKT
jgi:hypothetical protein